MKELIRTNQELTEEISILKEKIRKLEGTEAADGHTEEALRRSEEKYRLLFDHLPLGLLCFDEKSAIVACNDIFVQIIGSSREALIGLRMLNLPDKKIASAIEKALNGSTGSYEGDYHSVTAKKITPVRVVFTPLIVEGGRILGGVGIIEDITERKQVEGALRESEAKHRILLEESSDPIFSFTPKGQYIYVNRAFAAGVGKPVEDIIGKTLWDVFPGEEADKRFRALSQVFRAGEEKVIEVRVPRTDGDRYYMTTITPVKDKAGEAVSAICSSKDITERRRMEEKLFGSEEKFRTLAEFSPFAIAMTQGDRWIYANRAAQEISGYTEAEFYRMHFWDFVHPDHRDMVKQRGLDRQQGKARPRAYEFKIIAKNGVEKWVSLTGNRILYEDKPAALVSIIDITERKRTEEEKAKFGAQLQQAQKMESVGRLAGGVAHDFNNMLGVILGHAELAMLRADLSPSLRDDLTEIRKAAERSSELTRQLLAFARKQTVAPKVLDMNETVSSMLKMLKRLIGEDIDLRWQPAADLWQVKMDPSQVDQILVNLCVNARDAIRGVGKITIETANVDLDEEYCAVHAGFVPGEYVCIVVSDNGCGMSKETLSHLFEPFFTTKAVGKGTGLGLATVYGVIKQNNGFINTYSEPGQGTTFTIYLPREVDKAGREWTEALATPAQRGHETILLAEDEPAILELTTTMLEMQGYEVLAAGTPGEALRLAREYKGDIHLLMTDVVMPEMNGRDLAKNLLSLYPDIKRLFMSGYTANVIAHHGVLDKGIYFIQKPFTMKAMADKVREVLDSE